MAVGGGDGIFISYRRHQNRDFAGRLHDRLADLFGEAQVFMDVDTIEPGVDFAEEISRAVAACQVLLAVIGRNWLTATDNRGRRRLDDPEDLVRLEIEAALARDVRVVPILVEDAVMPGREDLPESIVGLARRNALRIRHESFRDDSGRLVTAIKRVLGVPGTAALPSDPDTQGTPTIGPALAELTQKRLGPTRDDLVWGEAGGGTADTLAQHREEPDGTLAEERTRTLNERFATAASQLGGDNPPAVRLAGVYAMAGLADDWAENRQTCVDVLCAYLRMPYQPDPGEGAPEPQRLAFRASREVRHTVIRIITAHLKDRASVSWRGLNFDFTGVVFDGGEFTRANFSGGDVSFRRATFSGNVSFSSAEFSDGHVSFRRAKFIRGRVGFNSATFHGGQVRFQSAEFSGSRVSFRKAKFDGGHVSFRSAAFSRGTISFRSAVFSGGSVGFASAAFSGATVAFPSAVFGGGTVYFKNAQFSGGEVDFSGAADWSRPPEFPCTGTPPPGVKLPKKEDQSQS